MALSYRALPLLAALAAPLPACGGSTSDAPPARPSPGAVAARKTPEEAKHRRERG